MHPARLVLAATLALCATSCSEDKPGPSPAAISAPAATSEAVRARAEFESVPASAGSIEGLILFDGTPPQRVLINTAAEGGCGLDPNQPPLTEIWVIDHGRMANVFVWLADPPPEEKSRPIPTEAVLLRQQGCVYRPHAVGLRAGQTLRVTNEDRARHNVHALSRRNDDLNLNRSQDAGSPALDLVCAAPEVAVQFVCDLHPWMKAWVGIFDSRFFAVTGADGRFSWSGLPPGNYTVNAWHEALGKTSGQAVVTKEAGARVCITFKKKS
jgi:plastocyanin